MCAPFPLECDKFESIFRAYSLNLWIRFGRVKASSSHFPWKNPNFPLFKLSSCFRKRIGKFLGENSFSFLVYFGRPKGELQRLEIFFWVDLSGGFLFSLSFFSVQTFWEEFQDILERVSKIVRNKWSTDWWANRSSGFRFVIWCSCFRLGWRLLLMLLVLVSVLLHPKRTESPYSNKLAK